MEIYTKKSHRYKEKWAMVSNFLDSSIATSDPPRGYRYLGQPADLVLYPFGHGLSYRNYTCSMQSRHFTVSAAEIQNGGNVTVPIRVTVSPSHNMNGARSVLLFLSHSTATEGNDDGIDNENTARGGGLPQRKMWLADFDKVFCPAGRNDFLY